MCFLNIDTHQMHVSSPPYTATHLEAPASPPIDAPRFPRPSWPVFVSAVKLMSSGVWTQLNVQQSEDTFDEISATDYDSNRYRRQFHDMKSAASGAIGLCLSTTTIIRV